MNIIHIFTSLLTHIFILTGCGFGFFPSCIFLKFVSLLEFFFLFLWIYYFCFFFSKQHIFLDENFLKVTCSWKRKKKYLHLYFVISEINYIISWCNAKRLLIDRNVKALCSSAETKNLFPFRLLFFLLSWTPYFLFICLIDWFECIKNSNIYLCYENKN